MEIERKRPEHCGHGSSTSVAWRLFSDHPTIDWAMRHGNYRRRLFQRGTWDGKTPFFGISNVTMVARLLFGNYPKASPLEEAHHFPAAGDAEGHCGQREQACTKMSWKNSSQQERKQQQRVRATNHRSHQPMRGKANWHLRRSSTTRYSQRKMQKWERKVIKTARDRQSTRWSRTTSHHPKEELAGQ